MIICVICQEKDTVKTGQHNRFTEAIFIASK